MHDISYRWSFVLEYFTKPYTAFFGYNMLLIINVHSPEKYDLSVWSVIHNDLQISWLGDPFKKMCNLLGEAKIKFSKHTLLSLISPLAKSLQPFKLRSFSAAFVPRLFSGEAWKHNPTLPRAPCSHSLEPLAPYAPRLLLGTAEGASWVDGVTGGGKG